MMNKIRKYFNFNNGIYIIFSIYIVTMLLPETSISILEGTFENIVKIIRYGCYFFFIAKIFWGWKNEKTKITVMLLVIAILFFIIYYFSGKQSLLIMMIALFALRNTNKGKLIKIALITYIITFFTVIVCSWIGLIPDWTYNRGETIRHSLGFSYPTITMVYYLMITLMYIYTRKNKITIYEIIILEIINVLLYKSTAGRTTYILVTIVLILSLLKKIKILNNILKKETFQKILKESCYILPTLALLFILIMTYLYSINNPFAISINKTLSNRILLTEKAFQEYDITLFGQETQWNGWGGVGYIEEIDKNNYVYNFLDNSYARLILDYGIILTILVILGYTCILIQNFKKKDYWMVFVIFIILILSELEPHLIDLNKNIFVISLIPLLDYKPIKQLTYRNIIKKFSIKKRKKNEQHNI